MTQPNIRQVILFCDPFRVVSVGYRILVLTLLAHERLYPAVRCLAPLVHVIGGLLLVTDDPKDH